MTPGRDNCGDPLLTRSVVELKGFYKAWPDFARCSSVYLLVTVQPSVILPM